MNLAIGIRTNTTRSRIGRRTVVIGSLAASSLLAVVLFSACRHVSGESVQAKGRTPLSLQQALNLGRVDGYLLAERSAGRASMLFTLTNRERTMKIELFPDLEAEAARAIVQDGIMSLQALYANALSPYPGDISHRLEASPKFRPQFFTNTVGNVTYSYFLLFANERLSYGATAEDLVRYKSLLGWFHCGPAGNLYKVRLFVPLTTESRELEEFLVGLCCP
jgi:hypothetical protein